jgi:hypothetical protein
MIAAAWRLARGYRLTPWRSPYLKWRIETFEGLHAELIGFAEFLSFTWRRRKSLTRFLAWCDRMAR